MFFKYGSGKIADGLWALVSEAGRYPRAAGGLVCVVTRVLITWLRASMLFVALLEIARAECRVK